MNLKLRIDLKRTFFSAPDGDFYIYEDELGIISQQILIPLALDPILQLFNGISSLDEIFEIHSNISPEKLSKTDFKALIKNIESLGFFENDYYIIAKKEIEEYLKLEERPYVCAGTSYPNYPEDIKNVFNLYYKKFSPESDLAPKILFAPHIDFRLGDVSMESYIKSFGLLKGLSDKKDLTFVIFGTAHYKNSDFFMFTKKQYSSPLGKVDNNTELINQVQSKLNFELKFDELAHRPEHSIEYHVIMLQYILGHSNFKVLPILTGNISNVNQNTAPEAYARYQTYLSAFESAFNENESLYFLGSCDLSHIGRRFDDNFDAQNMFEELVNFDKKVIESLLKSDGEGFKNNIENEQVDYKVCGLSPFYSLLKILKPKEGRLLSYNIWDDRPTKTAVSYCSIAYYN